MNTIIQGGCLIGTRWDWPHFLWNLLQFSDCQVQSPFSLKAKVSRVGVCGYSSFQSTDTAERVGRFLRLIQNPAVCSLFDLQGNSEVWIVRAWQNNYDAPLGLNSTLQHSHTGVSTKKYNLIKEATANGMKMRVTTYTILSLIVFTYLL